MKTGIKIHQIYKTQVYKWTRMIVLKVNCNINKKAAGSVLSNLKKSNHLLAFITKEVF